jgi:hypothetical protein
LGSEDAATNAKPLQTTHKPIFYSGVGIMFRNLLTAGALLIALTFGMTATASAHGPNGGHNYVGKKHGNHNYVGHNHGGHNHGGYKYGAYKQGGSISFGGVNIGWGGYPTYHDTTHLHYHQGGYQQHGNHFHYVPGHYDVHQSGHYHW